MVSDTLVYSGSQLISSHFYHYNFESSLDQAIPFLPWTIVLYYMAFPYWYFGTIYIVRYDKDRAFRFLCADLLCEMVALAFFLFLPSTNTRPVVDGTGLFDYAMRHMYSVDPATNLFPSLHCLFSWILWLAIYNEPRISKFVKASTFVLTIAIFISTLTTKQHIIIDTIGGFAIASFFYWLCGSKKVTRFYYKLFDRDFRFLQ